MWYIVGRPNRKRIRAWFKTKEAAQAEATERNLGMRKLGENAVALDAALAETARDGATRLKPLGKTLKDAIDFYLSHLIALQSLFDDLLSRFVRFGHPRPLLYAYPSAGRAMRIFSRSRSEVKARRRT